MGGRVSYLQGVAARGALDELIKEVGRSGILKKKEQVDKFIDIYNDMFELSSRVAAYRLIKDEYYNQNLKNKMNPAEAKEDARFVLLSMLRTCQLRADRSLG
jgi:cob(I)alamin adenosyltransferase